jgi:hypothetical protein
MATSKLLQETFNEEPSLFLINNNYSHLENQFLFLQSNKTSTDNKYLQIAAELVLNEYNSNCFFQSEQKALVESSSKVQKQCLDSAAQISLDFNQVRRNIRNMFGDRVVVFGGEKNQTNSNNAKNHNRNNKNNEIISINDDEDAADGMMLLLTQDQQPQLAQQQQTTQQQQQSSSTTTVPLVSSNENRRTCVENEIFIGMYSRIAVSSLLRTEFNKRLPENRRRQRAVTEFSLLHQKETQTNEEKLSLLEETLGFPAGSASNILLDTHRQKVRDAKCRRELVASTAMRRDLTKHVLGNILPLVKEEKEMLENDVANMKKKLAED